jgi:hypothetical protein
MSQKEREQLHAEFAILSSLRHPNIVGYYHREHLKSTQDLHLYMEYCGNGDLGRVIKDLALKKQYAEEGFVWSMFSQLVTALFRCHYGVDPPEVGSNVMGLGNTARPRQPAGGVMILHRDLKPENGKYPHIFLKAWSNVCQSSWEKITLSSLAISVSPKSCNRTTLPLHTSAHLSICHPKSAPQNDIRSSPIFGHWVALCTNFAPESHPSTPSHISN